MARPKNQICDSRANVLLVDEPANLAGLRSLLEGGGYNLVEAGSGEEALRRLLDDDFAVILLSVQIPGLDSFETAKFIRNQERSRYTPIIFCSNSQVPESQVIRAYALGDVHDLTKPLVPEILQAKVAQFVEIFEQLRAAKRQAEQFQFLIQGTKEYAIFMLDPEGHVLTWNPGAERIKGYQAEEIIGQHFSRFYPTEEVQAGKPERELQQAIATGKYEEEGLRLRKDGSRFWASVVITTLRDESGTLRGFSKVTRDMTERKRAEETARRLLQEEAARQAAEAQREQLRVTLESIGDAVIATDPAGRVTRLNPVAERLTGWSSAEALGQPLGRVFNIIHEQTRRPVENPVDRVIREGTVVGLGNHTVLIARDGTEKPIDDSAAPIRDDKGGVLGVVLVFRDVTEKRRLERLERDLRGQLERQTEFQQAVMADMNEGLYAVDTQGLVTYMNPAAEAMFGWTSAELVGRRMHDITHYKHPDGTPFPIEECAGFKVLHEGKVLKDYDDVFIRKDGSFFPVVYSSSPLITNGKTVGLVVVFRDVTERRRFEDMLRSVVDHVIDGIITIDARGMIQSFNPAAEKLFGYHAAEVIGQNVKVLMPEPYHDQHDDYIRNYLNTGQAKIIGIGREVVGRCKDGSTFPMDLAVSEFHLGAQRFFTGIVRDITERKKAEQDTRFLADASAALAALVDYESTLQKLARLAVPFFADWCLVDMAEGDGSLRRVAVAHIDPAKMARAHEAYIRYPPDPKASQGPPLVIRTGQPEIVPEITDAMLVATIKDEEHLQLLREFGLKSYMCVPLLIQGKALGAITFLAAESGRRYGSQDLATAKDLAHRAAVAMENARLYSEVRDADRKKDEFIAMLAHELRNPLAPIRNALQVLRMRGVDARTTERARDMMERQVHQVVRLVDDLLDVSRIIQGKIELRKEPIEVATIIARAVETAQPAVDAQGHELSITLSPEPIWVEGDLIRLAQVVANLLNNSAKYMELGGHIWLTAKQEGTELVLRVRDAGIGIASEMLPQVFGLFVQAEQSRDRTQGGLGIGLTLVHRLVTMHGGSVTASSAGLGKGSEFTIRLPALPEPPAFARDRLKQIEAPPPPQLPSRRILVVDDNLDAAESLAMLLQLQGQEVKVASDGPAALEAAREFQPEVLFLDIGMPGMDGYEVARRLRRQPGMEKVVLIALTGWGQEEDRRRSREAGFDRHVVKPVEPEVLNALLISVGN
jgi:PAS domain S-box-containing protein